MTLYTSGVFTDATGNVILTLPYSLPAVSVGLVATGAQTIYYTAPANSVASTFVTFTVTDSKSVPSAPVTVAICILPAFILFYFILFHLILFRIQICLFDYQKAVRADKAPITSLIAPIVTPMIGNSSLFLLGGTDLDPADTFTTLQVVIDQLPTKGTLVSGSTDIITLDTFSNNASFYLRGSEVAGSDQFSFHVVDSIFL